MVVASVPSMRLPPPSTHCVMSDLDEFGDESGDDSAPSSPSRRSFADLSDTTTDEHLILSPQSPLLSGQPLLTSLGAEPDNTWRTLSTPHSSLPDTAPYTSSHPGARQSSYFHANYWPTSRAAHSAIRGCGPASFPGRHNSFQPGNNTWPVHHLIYSIPSPLSPVLPHNPTILILILLDYRIPLLRTYSPRLRDPSTTHSNLQIDDSSCNKTSHLLPSAMVQTVARMVLLVRGNLHLKLGTYSQAV